MVSFSKLRGLKASDRTKEEQAAINQQMGYKNQPEQEEIKINSSPSPSTPAPTHLPAGVKLDMSAVGGKKEKTLAQKMKELGPVVQHLDNTYKDALAEYQEKYGVGRNTVNSNASDFLDKVSSDVSSYYKKYYGTSKLTDNDIDKKKLTADYLAHAKAYGKDYANTWLDKQYKNIVGSNQSWLEQALDGASHLIPAIEGGAVQLAGNIWGTVNPIVSLFSNNLDLPDNEDLNWWDNYWNNIIDNPITRLGRDIEHSGASYIAQGLTNLLGINDETASERIEATKASATKYNPEGIGADAIVTTEDQDNSLVSSATPWQALQSGGFTTLSMITGGALAKGSSMLFNTLAKGTNYANKVGKLIKTEQALEKTLKGLKTMQNGANTWLIPGLVGGTEGMVEGLNTKIQVEQDNVKNLDDFYKKKVEDEVNAIWEVEKDKPQTMTEVRGRDGSKTMVRTGGKSREQIYSEVWNKYKDEYFDSRRQIEVAASKAGQYNLWANSLINGMLNTTLKAGLQAKPVQESIRNSRLLGWAYRNPEFRIVNGEAIKKFSKLGTVLKILKEPAGEGMEEYLQSLSNDTMAGAAENNINEFIKARFNGDGTVKVGDTFSSDWTAALTALGESAINKESAQSAILGAVGSAMGTLASPSTSYHRNSEGKLEEYSIFDPRNYKRNLRPDGTQESYWDMAARITPWRSSVINAYRERKHEMDAADETAKHITEWLRDPRHQEKWDGMVGTASWLSQMERAAESNDQFSYRKAQMGKAINDVMMLSKLEGTDFYDTIMKQLQTASEMDVNSEEGKTIIEQMKNAGGKEYQEKSDEEILDKVKSNANKMLGIMSKAEREGKNIDRMLGRIDEDTKQSLIFGKIMEEDFTQRRDQLEGEINDIKGQIKNSRQSSGTTLDEDLKSLIIKHGTVSNAIKAYDKLDNQREKAVERKKELEAIDKSKRSEKQNEELQAKKEEIKSLDSQLSEFKGLNARTEKGKRVENTVDPTLDNMVLNEQEIMDLDPTTRAMVIAQGSKRFYNATHQNRQKIDDLNQQISEIQSKIDALEEKKKNWMDSTGRVRKGHNKQVEKTNKVIKQLEKDKYTKERDLQVEKGELDTKPVYSEAQQAVIDNLLQQASAVDEGFLDKVIDMSRLDRGIKSYHSQFQAILTDPNAFRNYVQKAKVNASLDIARRRAEWVSTIKDYKDYARELDKLLANASPMETMTIFDALKQSENERKREIERQREEENTDTILNEEDSTEGQAVIDENGESIIEETSEKEATPVEAESNFERYRRNQRQQEEIIAQFPKHENLTDNAMSLLMDAMQYLAQNGVEVTDRENAVEALLEKDAAGILGGKFRQWVEERNSSLPLQQQAHMPQFTSIGEIVNDYVEILNGREVDNINRTNANPTISHLAEGANGVINEETGEITPITPKPEVSTPFTPEPPAPQQKKKSIFDMGYSSPEGGQFVDNDGTVATGAAVEAGNQRETKKAEEENRKEAGEDENINDIELAFRNVTTPEIARTVGIADTILEAIQFIEESKNIPITDKEKELARQSLIDVAVNSEETFDTMDEVVDAILDKVDELQKQQDMMEDETDKTYGHASIALKNISQRLKVAQQRRRRVDTHPRRPANTQSSIIHTADIAWIEQKNLDAWAVKFTNDHAIEEYCREHTFPTDMPIYFITDSEWSAEVTRQMDDSNSNRSYDTLTDMPIVAAVEVVEPKNADTTTAIKVGDKWYQPVGVMPSTKSKVSGSERTFAIRQLASKEQGTHLVTADGMPNGKPLISYVFGKNYIDAFHPDDTQNRRNNGQENNTDVQEDILKTLPLNSVQRLQGMSKAEMLKDPEYVAARTKFINRLSWGAGYAGNTSVLNNQMLYTPDDLKHNEGRTTDTSAQPIVVAMKPMSETTARESDRSLTDVLENGTVDEAVTFNSITQRLYSKVIRPLFEHIPMADGSDVSAGVITQADMAANPNALQEEAERLTKMFNGFDGTTATKGLRGISDYIFISQSTGYSVKVMADEEASTIGDMDNSKSVYSVFLTNEDGSSVVGLGQIVATPKTGAPNQENIDRAKRILQNFLKECTSGVLSGKATWQNVKNDVLNLNINDTARSNKARGVLADMVDDGVFDLWGSSLVYNIKGLELKAPIATDGRIIYPVDKVVNPSNAQPSAPINNTPQAQGTVETNNGAIVEAGSGAILNNPPAKPIPKGKSEAEKKAEAIINKIVADTAGFTLLEDESYYYVTDKETGQRVKYLRVTTVIGADESTTQWFPTAQELKDKLGLTELANNAAVAINTAAGKEDTGEGALQKSLISDAIDVLSKTSGKSKQEIQKAIAELRTEHKKTKYGPWGVPSTTLGNTADIITRDFFAGELKDHYPNVTDAVLFSFKASLNAFKNDLTSKGIKIVSRDVMAHGKITVTGENGSSHEVNVAGTLDLLGYDDKGNFYIFDMKTSRNVTNDKEGKLQRNKAKWSRQISLYADLLKQSYPGFDVKPENLRIIPINVSYPAPQGKGRGLNPFGGTYSVVPKGQPNEGQLQVTDRRGNTTNYIIDHPDNFAMLSSDLQGQFQPGYTHFNISWDNLSSEDQEIAGVLKEQVPANSEQQGEQPAIPNRAEIHTPRGSRAAFDRDAFHEEWEYEETIEAAPVVAPIIPAGYESSLPSWLDLSNEARQFIQEEGWAADESEYNDILDDPSAMEALKNELKCRGLM